MVEIENTATEQAQGDSLEPPIDNARRMVCLEAIWEIDALARALPEHGAMDESQQHLVVRGIAARISALAGSLMSGLGEADVTTAMLEHAVIFSPPSP